MKFIKLWKIWFIFSGSLVLISVLSLIFWHLKLGIDFSGGSLIELEFPKAKEVSEQQIRDTIRDLKLKDLLIQKTGSQSVFIRTETIDQKKFDQIKSELTKKVGETKEIRFETVGPVVSQNLAKRALISVILASIAIILYIAFSFRQVPKPANSFRFGIAAVIALIHDILIVTGIFAILGHFLGIEIDSLFITALLTILGFSVHDTIVVFDRIRENARLNLELSFEEVTEKSIGQTLDRSINTSLTVLIVLAALFIFGGESIKYNFVLPLIIGITFGTYSSIFVASTLLVIWQNWALRRQKTKA